MSIAKPEPGRRPVEYAPEIGSTICDWLDANETLREICTDPAMPDKVTVLRQHAALARTRSEPTAERDEFGAMRSAMPDLDRLERYRRRAWSRQRRAIRRFVQIQSACASAARPSNSSKANDVPQIRSVSNATQ
jgi:hypothetical protein